MQYCRVITQGYIRGYCKYAILNKVSKYKKEHCKSNTDKVSFYVVGIGLKTCSISSSCNLKERFKLIEVTLRYILRGIIPLNKNLQVMSILTLAEDGGVSLVFVARHVNFELR